MKKQLIKLFIIGIVSVVLISGCGKKANNSNNNDNNKTPLVNTKPEVIGDKQVEDFSFTNTSLVYNNNSSQLITKVKNTSTETKYLKSFNIIVTDSEGKVLVTLLGYIGDQIPAGETRTITSSTDLNIINCAKIEYTINK